MRVATVGLVQDEAQRILLIQRNDGRVWVPPSGGLEYGETLGKGVRREVFEETGLRVRAKEMTQVYFWPRYPGGALQFVFRCQVKGGTLTPSAESPQVGFFGWNELPRPVLAYHRGVIRRGLAHQGAWPVWGTAPHPQWMRAVFGLRDRVFKPLLSNWQARRGQFQPEPNWMVSASVVIRRNDGAVLWQFEPKAKGWKLPGGRSDMLESPWATARREVLEETGLTVGLLNLHHVKVRASKRLLLVFSGQILAGELTPNAEASKFGWFQPGEAPKKALANHRRRVATVVEGTGVKF